MRLHYGFQTSNAHLIAGLAKKREIITFLRTVVNTGISRETLKNKVQLHFIVLYIINMISKVRFSGYLVYVKMGQGDYEK